MPTDSVVRYGRHYGALHRTLTTRLPADQADDAIAALVELLGAAEKLHHDLGIVQAITILREQAAVLDRDTAISLLLAARTGQEA